MGKTKNRVDALAVLTHHVRRNKERIIARLSKWVEWSPSGCLLWRGTIKRDGYGCVNFRMPPNKHIQIRVHILFWVLANNRNVRKGFELDHTCQTPTCVLPHHLNEVTEQVNKSMVHERRRLNGY